MTRLTGKDIVHRIARETTLKIFRIGSEQKNFQMKQKLPMTARQIEKFWKLSDMPTNRILKILMDVGLVHREKKGAEIKTTKLAKDFMNLTKNIENDVVDEMSKLI